MRLLEIEAKGFQLFRESFHVKFYASSRVSEQDHENLFCLLPTLYLHNVVTFAGINASGKTTALKTILFVIHFLNNMPINYISTNEVLGTSSPSTLTCLILAGWIQSWYGAAVRIFFRMMSALSLGIIRNTVTNCRCGIC